MKNDDFFPLVKKMIDRLKTQKTDVGKKNPLRL